MDLSIVPCLLSQADMAGCQGGNVGIHVYASMTMAAVLAPAPHVHIHWLCRLFIWQGVERSVVVPLQISSIMRRVIPLLVAAVVVTICEGAVPDTVYIPPKAKDCYLGAKKCPRQVVILAEEQINLAVAGNNIRSLEEEAVDGAGEWRMKRRSPSGYSSLSYLELLMRQKR